MKLTQSCLKPITWKQPRLETVATVGKRKGPSENRSRQWNRWMQWDEWAVWWMDMMGFTSKQMAEALGRHEGSVKSKRQQLGLSVRDRWA